MPMLAIWPEWQSLQWLPQQSLEMPIIPVLAMLRTWLCLSEVKAGEIFRNRPRVVLIPPRRTQDVSPAGESSRQPVTAQDVHPPSRIGVAWGHDRSRADVLHVVSLPVLSPCLTSMAQRWHLPPLGVAMVSTALVCGMRTMQRVCPGHDTRSPRMVSSTCPKYSHFFCRSAL
jgi:hypothetical protein